jgi:hypothetical protein
MSRAIFLHSKKLKEFNEIGLSRKGAGRATASFSIRIGVRLRDFAAIHLSCLSEVQVQNRPFGFLDCDFSARAVLAPYGRSGPHCGRAT